MKFSQDKIRNFCIIAHIDHGKSTLSDRFLQLTGTVPERKMQAQLLDSMELERERGITIKLTPVNMDYDYNGEKYRLNLIDTPGHIDFNYEVSRSLAACEGAILVVDATQGVQAQTVANLYLAIEQGLEIIPVINKIDLPNSDVERVSKEIIHLLGCKKEEILHASAKTGLGVKEIIDAVIQRIPSPKGDENDSNTKALIFDSKYDKYRGAVMYIRVVNGSLKKGDLVKLINKNTQAEVLDIGLLQPDMKPLNSLETGQIGYLVTNIKTISETKVGDTITLLKNSHIEPLPGYKKVKPFVFAGIFCKDSSEFTILRDAMEEIVLSDSAIEYTPEASHGLGFGFRCGFLGLLHLEIISERLKREYDLDLIITTPSVEYKVLLKEGTEELIHSPQELKDPSFVDKVFEPFVSCEIIVQTEFTGAIMEIMQEYYGIYKSMSYLEETRVMFKYEMPLASILVDFYDKLKSVSKGYASLSYEYLDFREADIIKLDISVAEDPVDALSILTYRKDAYKHGKRIVEKLKSILPRESFEIKLQASINGGKPIASERISAMRKDVLAKMSGGDYTRKLKLLQKQKEGKKKMMGKGSVDIPHSVFLEMLKR